MFLEPARNKCTEPGSNGKDQNIVHVTIFATQYWDCKTREGLALSSVIWFGEFLSSETVTT